MKKMVDNTLKTTIWLLERKGGCGKKDGAKDEKKMHFWILVWIILSYINCVLKYVWTCKLVVSDEDVCDIILYIEYQF